MKRCLGWLLAAATLIVPAPVVQADGMGARQWYLAAMQSDELWSVSTGRGITIAVLDTGVDSTVPELRGKVLPGSNFYDGHGQGRTDDEDTEHHGTNMSLAIAGNGVNGGVNGVAPGVRILPVKVGDNHNFGIAASSVDGIRYAVDHGARIINISMGGPARTTDRPQWRAAVNYALKRGALIFAGAGNDGTGDPQYPAAIPGVVAVGALEPDGTHASFSNHGDHLALAAPGVDMPGRCSADKTKYCAFDGTSHATAIASASAALIWSAHPDWTGNQVLRVMLQTAGHDGPVPSRYIGYGSVRPAQVLLEGKGDPGDPDVHPLLAAAQAISPPPAPPRAAGAPEPAPEPAPAPPRTTWRMPAIVVATALLLAALTTLAVLRRRRAHPPTPRSTT